MTCPAVTLPLLANQDDPTKLQSKLSNQKQCIMAPSLKEQPMMTPCIINQDPSPAPCAKREQKVPDLDLDDSLTSLNWLHNLKMMKIEQPTPPSSPVPFSYTSHQPENLPTYIENQQLKMMTESCGQVDCKSVLHRTESMHDTFDYKQNGYMKPPYSYATLIWMAMKASNKSKITLSEIYKWITENFKYYQTAEPSWQNSIRHNLSLNKCFEKVPRRKDEPGKGGFWRIDPVHAELLESSIWKKRRALSLPEMDHAPFKRIKTESVDFPTQDQQEEPPQVLPTIELEEDVFEVEVIQPKIELSKSSSKKHKSKSKKSKHKSKHSKRSKRASRKVSSQYDSSMSEDDNLPSSVLNGNFQWDSIFDSEIEIDGIRVRAEAILNPNGEVQLLPVMDSPPQSEENEDFSMFLQEESPLDLSIKGTHIPKPLWFESQTKLEDVGTEQDILNESMDDLFGMRGEFPPSPASSLTDQTNHPWAEAREQMEDIYFEEFLNLGDSGNCAGASGSWAPANAIQTVIIEK